MPQLEERSLRMVLLLAAAYLLIGITFAEFSDWATTKCDAPHVETIGVAGLLRRIRGSHCLRTISPGELASHDGDAREHRRRPWRGRSRGDSERA
jgi:hypothetical protein